MRISYISFIFLIPLLVFGQTANSVVQETKLGFSKELNLTFEEALDKVKSELKKEGFGVLTEVDVKATMKKKLDVDFRPYQILGVCNPPLAHQSLLAEEEIGLLLPCKFIVYVNENNKTVVAAVDPSIMMTMLGNEALTEVSAKVRKKFKKVMELL